MIGLGRRGQNLSGLHGEKKECGPHSVTLHASTDPELSADRVANHFVCFQTFSPGLRIDGENNRDSNTGYLCVVVVVGTIVVVVAVDVVVVEGGVVVVVVGAVN